MSVHIFYRPVTNNDKSIDGASTFLCILKKNFGDTPIELNRNHIEALKAIASCGYEGAEQLYDAIAEHDRIIVDARW